MIMVLVAYAYFDLLLRELLYCRPVNGSNLDQVLLHPGPIHHLMKLVYSVYMEGQLEIDSIWILYRRG